MSLTLRQTKGSKLTITEMDDNLTYLETLANSGSPTGSFTGSFTGEFTGDLTGTASYATAAATASWADNATTAADYLPLAGGIISGDLTINGTGSIASMILPVTSSGTPAWTGTDGEMLLGDDGSGNYVMWAYLGGQWRSGSLF